MTLKNLKYGRSGALDTLEDIEIKNINLNCLGKVVSKYHTAGKKSKLVIVSFADGHKALISTLSSFRFYNGQTASARLSKIF